MLNKIFEKLKSLFKSFGWHIFICIFAILIGTLLYQRLTSTFITAEFENLRPMRPNIKVFYKGYRIGKVLFVKPSENFTTTYMKIALRHNNLKLPNNIEIKLQREKDKWRKIDYIEIIYPEKPSNIYLQNGDLIKGTSTVDIETYLSSQEPESLDKIKENLNKTIEELYEAISALKDLFTSLNETVSENRQNINAAVNNLLGATKNINSVTRKLNNSIDQDRLNNSVSNIEETTGYVKNPTFELEVITKRINELTNSINSTMPNVTSSINQTGTLINNINEIACGVSSTLKKSFGGLRLIFGKTINEDCDTCP